MMSARACPCSRPRGRYQPADREDAQRQLHPRLAAQHATAPSLGLRRESPSPLEGGVRGRSARVLSHCSRDPAPQGARGEKEPRSGQLPVKDDANVRRHSYRYQRTLARPAEVEGVGFLTGAGVRLRFVPAPPDTGVVFVRTDLPAAAARPRPRRPGHRHAAPHHARPAARARSAWSSTSWPPWPACASTTATSS